MPPIETTAEAETEKNVLMTDAVEPEVGKAMDTTKTETDNTGKTSMQIDDDNNDDNKDSTNTNTNDQEEKEMVEMNKYLDTIEEKNKSKQALVKSSLRAILKMLQVRRMLVLESYTYRCTNEYMDCLIIFPRGWSLYGYMISVHMRVYIFSLLFVLCTCTHTHPHTPARINVHPLRKHQICISYFAHTTYTHRTIIVYCRTSARNPKKPNTEKCEPRIS